MVTNGHRVTVPPQHQSHCNLKKNVLWRLWRPVFPTLFGPSDGPPPCGGGGGIARGWGITRGGIYASGRVVFTRLEAPRSLLEAAQCKQNPCRSLASTLAMWSVRSALQPEATAHLSTLLIAAAPVPDPKSNILWEGPKGFLTSQRI